MDNDFIWYRLTRLQGVGPKSLWTLFDYAYRTRSQVSELVADPNFFVPDLLKGQKLDFLLAQQDFDLLSVEYNSLLAQRVKVLHPQHEAFPQRIIEYGRKFDIPPILFVRGYLPLMQANSISIVGSRHIADDGLELAEILAKDLARQGFNVVSGYAKGVDSQAHYGALAVEGTTTIVLSLGILNFEAKKEFKPLFTSSNTLVVSQFSPNEKWLARNAMARNGLVCALSDALVVIASGPEIDDMGKMSGTFDAAKKALNMGLTVFVVSPSYFSNPPQGNIALIQLGCRELIPAMGITQIIKVIQNRKAVTSFVQSTKVEAEQLSFDCLL